MWNSRGISRQPSPGRGDYFRRSKWKNNQGEPRMNEPKKNEPDVDLKVSEKINEIRDDLTFKLSPSLLDCPVCSRPLHSTVFQCANGHTTCSDCRTKQKDVCSICKLSSNIRCVALESIISSLKVRCIYASYGCTEFVSYTQKDAHEGSCSSAPWSCPFIACLFECLAHQYDEMIAHFHLFHTHFFLNIEFDRYYNYILAPGDTCYVIHGNDKAVFLLIQDAEKSHGNLLSVVCLFQPTSTCYGYQYEVKVKVDEYESLSFTSMAAMTKKWEGIYPKRYLFIPGDVVCSMNGYIGVDICIRKIDN